MNEQAKIPAGFYRGRAIAGSEQYATNPKNGNEQIAVDFDIPSLSRALTVFFYFSENASQYAVEKLRACGWTGDNIGSLTGIDANEVDISIKYEVYEGKERMKVDVSTGGGRVKLENQMDEKAKRAFAARMKSFVAGSAKPAAPVQRPATSKPALQTVDPFGPDDRSYLSESDEIPF